MASETNKVNHQTNSPGAIDVDNGLRYIRDSLIIAGVPENQINSVMIAIVNPILRKYIPGYTLTSDTLSYWSM